jgi:hypothetical protein
MPIAPSGPIGCPVRASDGDVGTVKDFLLDDRTWKIRWMAVDASLLLPGRRVFVYPSAIAPLTAAPKPKPPMMSMGEALVLTVNLAKEQIEAGPHSGEDEAVNRDMEAPLYDYYGWDPCWGSTHFGAAVLPNAESRIVGDEVRREADAKIPPLDGAEHLQSIESSRVLHSRPGWRHWPR